MEFGARDDPTISINKLFDKEDGEFISKFQRPMRPQRIFEHILFNGLSIMIPVVANFLYQVQYETP